MYLDNKYTKLYYTIIQNATNRPIQSTVYYEVHHIIPKSLGGDNSSYNLVRLTAREHLICHLLLTKMTEGTHRAKMITAVWAMTNLSNSLQDRCKLTPRQYARVREDFAKLQSDKMTACNPMHNSVVKERHKINNKNAQNKVTTREKKSANMKSRWQNRNFAASIKKKMKDAANREETRIKKSMSLTGRKQTVIECPHCGLQGGNNMKRYHFENCKILLWVNKV